MITNYLREIRQDRGLTTEQLAEKVGTSNQQVSNHEIGKRKLNIEWIRKYSDALECHPSDIIDGPAAPTTERSKKMLETFENMSDQDQERFISMAEAYIKKEE